MGQSGFRLLPAVAAGLSSGSRLDVAPADEWIRCVTPRSGVTGGVNGCTEAVEER